MNGFNICTDPSTKLRNTYGVFNQVYQPGAPSVINTPNFTNLNQTIDNNIKESVIKDEVIVRVISISSFDRDILLYPDPFSFKVKFRPINDEILRINKRTGKTEKLAHQPSIGYKLDMVKYAGVYKIILPNIKRPFTFDRDMYTILDITELQGDSRYTTSQAIEGSFCPIYFDGVINKSFSQFKNDAFSRLFIDPINVDTLTISFYNSRGQQITYYTKEQMAEIRKCAAIPTCLCGDPLYVNEYDDVKINEKKCVLCNKPLCDDGKTIYFNNNFFCGKCREALGAYNKKVIEKETGLDEILSQDENPIKLIMEPGRLNVAKDNSSQSTASYISSVSTESGHSDISSIISDKSSGSTTGVNVNESKIIGVDGNTIMSQNSPNKFISDSKLVGVDGKPLISQSASKKWKYKDCNDTESCKSNKSDSTCKSNKSDERRCKRCPEYCSCNTHLHPYNPAIQVHLSLVFTIYQDNINLELPRGIKE